MDFSTAKTWFGDDRIRELAESSDGLRFLKLRSLSRREHLEALFRMASITPQATSARDLEIWSNLVDEDFSSGVFSYSVHEWNAGDHVGHEC